MKAEEIEGETEGDFPDNSNINHFLKQSQGGGKGGESPVTPKCAHKQTVPTS